MPRPWRMSSFTINPETRSLSGSMIFALAVLSHADAKRFACLNPMGVRDPANAPKKALVGSNRI
ncbi:hypothetical protein C6A37_07170 [Desulfobacteraceae bacterium SEEP-SAG9]|nr:hypothetical protein C6A37_07170 [Desulfobacteraceae bacterium SEEP-SAG9]